MKIFASFLVGSVIFAQAVFGDGGVNGFREHVYWPGGGIKECRVLDRNGSLVALAFYRPDGTIERIERYNNIGKKTEVSLYDERGGLKAGIDGWAAMRWFYDADGMMRSQIVYDERGIPIERKMYSPGGRLILRQFNDEVKSDPYEEASMFLFLGGANVPYYENHRVNDEDALMTKSGKIRAMASGGGQ